MLMANYTTIEVIDHYGIEFVDKLQDIIDASEKQHGGSLFNERTCSCPAFEALKAIPIFGKPPRSDTEIPDRGGRQA